MEKKSNCSRCNILKSFYTIMTFDPQLGTHIEFKVGLCWKCGKFSITPDIMNDFTSSLLANPLIILDLIKLKKLKPIGNS